MRMRKPHLEGKSRTEPFMCFHIMFNVSGVRSEHLVSILFKKITDENVYNFLCSVQNID